MKFADFLHEQKEKHAVMAFGRMNPLTSGHEKLVNKVKSIAQDVDGTPHIVVSHSQDSEKNPLSAAQKLKHAKRAFPGVHVMASDKDAPNFLAQAAKLHKQGVTHFHMVGGQDRVDEFHKLLHKYNGVKGAHGHFNFKKIKVHSAGDRDPDAEGVEGMSASKMREHAKSNNFAKFKKGVPSSMSHEHAFEMFKDVRKGMGIKEDVNVEFEEMLNEGVHDKSIFKAVFLAGGPGSGKDYVLDNTLQGHGLVEINSDKALEFLMDKHGLDKTMPATERQRRDLVRGKAKNMTELRQRLALMGRNGLIINGTGDDHEKIGNIKKKLEELGYETSMVMVNTNNDVSKQRNIERGQRGGRTVPEEIRQQKWNDSQNARAKYAEMFKHNYHEFDNSEDLRTAAPEVVKAKKQEMMDIYKNIQKFTSAAPKNDTSKNWVASELERKDLLKVDKERIVKDPHGSSKAAEQAKRMGLQYFGFGRYGTNGKVTHRSVHDRLTEVPKEPTKKVNEEFESLLSESFDFSDSSAMNLLLLGTNVQEFEISQVEEEKKPKYLTDKSGKIRTFMLRSAAAREAHTINGTVIPYKNGYVIKLKEENQNDQLYQKSIYETIGGEPSFRRSNKEVPTSGTITTSAILTEQATTIENCGCEKTTNEKRKISIKEIYERKKEKIKESIDKGIEPGLSMAGAGEGIGRDTGEKINKKGKATPVVDKMNELTGDETTMSIGDQKELELKRKGINLQTFKAKKFVG